ncbi:MAG TPA: septum formation family protein [Actinomycetales bacterium]|nr:septum formation family protein [Actinomycetales bacterium]
MLRALLLGGALLLGTVAVAFALFSADARDEKDVFSLAVGDCVNGLEAGGATEEYASTPVVPCSEPHEAEVITSFELDMAAYPGEAEVIAECERRCVDLIVAALPDEADAGAIMPFYFYPTRESWEQADDRTVHCLAMPSDGTATGSLLDR